MQRLYSKSTGTTYFKGFNRDIPADAMAITEALYILVLADPAPGKVLSHDAQGLPMLVDRPDLPPGTNHHAEF